MTPVCHLDEVIANALPDPTQLQLVGKKSLWSSTSQEELYQVTADLESLPMGSNAHHHGNEDELHAAPVEDNIDGEGSFWDAICTSAFEESRAAWQALLRQELDVLVEYCTAPRTSDKDPGTVAGTASADSKRVHVPPHRRWLPEPHARLPAPPRRGAG